jgi:hypothetical protein
MLCLKCSASMLNDSAVRLPARRLLRYALWGHDIVSEIDLGEIAQAPAVQAQRSPLPELYCKLLPFESPNESAEKTLVEHHTEDGRLWLAYSKCGENYLARFPNLCTFRIHPRKMCIECMPAPGAAPSTITHLLLDHAIPRFLSLQPGYLVLHAGAVVLDGHAVAILGPSGMGKSTLATYLASNGLFLLTDDCLVLRKEESGRNWLAEPGYASVRLWSDSSEALGIHDEELTEFAHYTDKKRTSSRVNMRHAIHKTSLTACLLLAPPVESGEPVITPLSTAEGFEALLHSVFRLDPESADLNRREFEAITDVLASARFYSLSYESSYSLLPAVHKVIMETIQGAQIPSAESV